MEALVGSQEEPEALAEHIRSLQQEWRTINKGIASDASAEAERFQQAYHAAFKPCQAFFAAQAAVRRENLEARKQVLERLQGVRSQPADRDTPTTRSSCACCARRRSSGAAIPGGSRCRSRH